jgi:hypothetical protein
MADFVTVARVGDIAAGSGRQVTVNHRCPTASLAAAL